MRGGAVLFLGVEGTAISTGEARILRRVEPGGIVLFGRNLESESQLRALMVELRALLPAGIFCVDSEGGRVDRLRNLVGSAPAAAALARIPSRFARRAGRNIGESLRTFDFDLDFAPVVDLDHGAVDNALDGRSFGSTPRAVTSRAGGFLAGLHSAGIGGCLKHFPGLGRATADTHLRGAHIAASADELLRDRRPFTELFANVDSVMVSHAIYPDLSRENFPASLNPEIARKLLVKNTGFRGAVFSDDLEMGALAEFGALPKIAASALHAGCHGLLFCRRIDEAPAIAKALGSSRHHARLGEATRRLGRLQKTLAKRKSAAKKPLDVETLRRRFELLAGDVDEALAALENS
ncbi:MAG: beta-N-acetylhexosaminidase [Thermoanaerobaculia bacterium]